ncbi:MAG TPA: phosphotransferase, partial [Longimicrobium sp.]|nr:phosphotransferase [Longimicrobium sp.]
PLPRDAAAYADAIRAILARHGLPGAPVEKPAGGSVPVLAAGPHAVKLFPPPFGRAAATEAAALAHVHGRLGIPTPRPVASGEMEGWHYVVMERLPGRLLSDAWEEIGEEDRAEISRRLGEAVARLHALPVDGLDVPAPEWDAFMRDQAAGCAARHASLGAPPEWVEQIPAFLASNPLPESGRRALLHTEVMREHVLVDRTDGGWAITGLFDFEPAMIGDPEYDGALLVARGDPAIVRAFLRGYGFEGDLTPDLQRRAVVYVLLHRYSNLRWYFDLVPPRTATTFEELAAEWWSFGE